MSTLKNSAKKNKLITLGIIQPSKKGNKEWKEFEVLVAKLEKFLCPLGAIVTSPDKIPDPQTGTLREIDATIRYKLGSADIIIAVECRNRASKQDVMWINGLYGKMLDLGVALTIGVSSRGFSEEAKRKALLHGIQLRKIDKISESYILTLLSLDLDCYGYKTKNCSFDFYGSYGQPVAVYMSGIADKGGLEALRDEKFLHYSRNGKVTKVSAFDIFEDMFKKGRANNAFESIVIPPNGESANITAVMKYDPEELYISPKAGDRYYLRQVTVDFVLFNNLDEFKAREKIEYVDAQNDEKVASVHEYVSSNSGSIFTKITYTLDHKTDAISLIGEKADGTEVDITGVRTK